ncbi:MAG: response regulator [Desulfobacula sp.]|jgi:CheY-like chemotaxis protein|uniref:response regulator n=1 Tax=Desulfobacula sp. TaxID=2593537 RepID=UPI001D201B8C|nr:response regulator [Desulfobacula sp.]MBT3806625.1 response regulator [Desulfobacula sp.]MBT4027778.1 response regulator [Desulfobacula sp.]MBT4201374.1 response regulator [Desulfobacula sp.]MBT4509017.1 response regulator [Desulfobacula sp.]
MENILENKSVLVVDDEPDILETLEELLYMCSVDTASSFEEAINLLKNNTYDVAVLDIMGVKGYELLEVTNRLQIPSLMLTAHALTPDNLKKSIEKGADAYIPKDKLVDISIFVEDVLAARGKGKKSQIKWFSLLEPMFNKLFGKGWKKTDKDFWDSFDEKQISSRSNNQNIE